MTKEVADHYQKLAESIGKQIKTNTTVGKNAEEERGGDRQRPGEQRVQ